MIHPRCIYFVTKVSQALLASVKKVSGKMLELREMFVNPARTMEKERERERGILLPLTTKS